MKKFLLAAVMVLYTGGIAFGSDQIKIGYIDLQKSLNESNQGKEAKAAFNKRVEELQKALDEKQSELKKLQEELEKQKGLLTPEARGDKEKAYQQKIKDAQRFAKDSQEELQQKDAELTKKIIKDLKDVIKKMGTDEEYTIILEKGDAFVLFAAEGVDITDKVIKAYNKMFTGSVFSGSGDKITPSFSHRGGRVDFSITHNGSKNFVVLLKNHDTGKNLELLVNIVGNYDGKKSLSLDAGDYYMEVSADGDWKVVISDLKKR